MRLDLSQLSTQTLSLQLTPPHTSHGEQQFVQLRETRALSGAFESSDAGIRLSDVQAEKAVIEALRIMFGSIVLSAQGATEILQVIADYASGAEGLDMDLLMGSLLCPQLSVEVGSVLAVAELSLEQGRVRVTADGGRIEVPNCVFREFSVTISGVKLSAPEIEVRDLVIAWSDGPFELHARDVSSAHFEFCVEGTKAEIHVLRASQLDVVGADWSMRGLSAQGAQLRMTAAETSSGEVAEAAEEAEEAKDAVAAELDEKPTKQETTEVYETKLPLLVWTLLDQLSGHINVDLGLDIKLPIFQHRRAVHHFRVPIEAGKLNHQVLEHGLAPLEDQLLDFSVRPGELVLELGIPLLPSRGHGKRLVRWALSEQEETEARQNWVRLATLAQPEILVGQGSNELKALPEGNGLSTENVLQQSDAPGLNLPQTENSETQAHDSDEDREGVLRQLTLRNLDLQLSLGQPLRPYEGALLKTLTVGSLIAHGDVVYRATGEVEQTHLNGSITDVMLSIDDFPLAGRKFDLNQVRLTGESRFEAKLENLKLLSCNVELGAINATSIDFGVFADGDVD